MTDGTFKRNHLGCVRHSPVYYGSWIGLALPFVGMNTVKFHYQMEKFSEARRALMLPAESDRAHRIGAAFTAMMRGLRELKTDEIVEPQVLDDLAQLKRLMDATGIEDPHGLGTHFLRAQRLTESEQDQLADVVDDLADYFCRKGGSGA
jgi:hypothetical protein